MARAVRVEPSGAVLVRPDGYVAWRHRGAAGPEQSSAAAQVQVALRAVLSTGSPLAAGFSL